MTSNKMSMYLLICIVNIQQGPFQTFYSKIEQSVTWEPKVQLLEMFDLIRTFEMVDVDVFWICKMFYLFCIHIVLGFYEFGNVQ